MKYNLLKKIVLILSILIGTKAAYSQTKQIATFKFDTYGGPSATVRVGNKTFFSATDSIHGRELWCTDGTILGTLLVKDINPGVGESIGDYFELSSYALNGILYFKAYDTINGFELWRSDGTTNGTTLVKDMTAGAANSSIGYFTSANNILYFTNGTGTQLWRSDGTSTGTYVVRSFSIITSLYGFNGKVYFSADDANNGQELWISNGTTGGTFLLKDLNNAVGTSLPCNFHATDNALYFMANTSLGWELWTTTGTASSTQLVKDINPGGNNGILSSYSTAIMTHIGNELYFRANDGINNYQFWKSDGTLNGTVKLSNLVNGVDAYSNYPIVGNKILLNDYTRAEFYEYNSITDSITISNYPSFSYLNTYPDKYYFIGDKMFYVSRDTLYGCEVWESNGNVNEIIQETHLSDNWNTYTNIGFNTILGSLDNLLFFTLARTPYSVDIPLFVYDSNDTTSCFPPSIIVADPVNDSTAHFIWNRVKDATNYEFRYREVGASLWNSNKTTQSYFTGYNLLFSTDYEFQARSFCKGIWTSWSDTQTFNSGFLQNSYVVNILAERCESGTVERIYWLRSPQITNLQIRYRPYGTSNWTSVFNDTGFKRIIGLIPNTFYEYQYRAELNGIWDQWYPANGYFVTSVDIPTGINNENYWNINVRLYPNPTTGKVEFLGRDFKNAKYQISNSTGIILKTGLLNSHAIDLDDFATGIYFIKIIQDNDVLNFKVVRN